MNYTNEEFAVLKRNEQHLTSAHNAWWVRNLPREEAEALRAIDIAHDGGKDTAFTISCGTCVLKMCRRLAPAYFADKEERTRVETTPTKTAKRTTKKVKLNL